MNFKVGDVVALKSGGPEMTVVGSALSFPEKHPMVECCWFDSSNDKKKGFFPPEALEKIQSTQMIEQTV